jgi:hypothetical protein
MATLRAVEDRDSKGNTIRFNPSITWKQDRQIRTIIGRHDWRLDDNPNYHGPITAQAQNGKIVFFAGTPDNAQSRTLAKEIDVKDVPKYIVDELTARPMKVRESRPTVYEVRIAKVGDIEVTQVDEMESDNGAVTVTPKAPDLQLRSGKPRAQDVEVVA